MKKKINMLLLLLLTSSLLTNPAKAAMYADGGGGTASGTISSTDTCKYGSYSGLSLGSLHAIRMSMVDSNGNRVAGTNSIDLTNKNTGGVANLTKYMMKVANDLPDGVWVHRLDGNYNRNEIIGGKPTAAINNTYGEYQIYYWNKLPYFNVAGTNSGGTILRRYFETNFGTTDIEDMKKIFSLMNYNGYNDKTIYNNHYILIEPIFYLYTYHPISEISNNKCNVTQTFYYGTGTEIFKMIVRDNTFYNYGSVNGTFQDIGTRVHDTATVAGLREADSIMNNRTAIKNYALTSSPAYGLASMHVWMTSVFEDTRGCTDLKGTTHYYSKEPSLSILDFDNKYCPGTRDPGYCEDNDSKKHYYTENPNLTKEEFVTKYCPNTSDKYCVDSNNNIHYYSKEPNLTKEQFDNKYCPVSNSCSTDVKISTTTQCDPNTGAYQVIEDTSDWNCIYQKWNSEVNTYDGEFYAPNGDTQFMGLSSSNPYCTVACRESVSYSFPSSFNVLAGGRFTIGSVSEGASSLGPITMRGTTTCNTGYNKETNSVSINIDKFTKEYAEANRKVAEAWDLYQIERAKERSIKGDHTRTLIETGIHACSDTEIDYSRCLRQGEVTCKVSGTSHGGAGWGPHDCDGSKSDAEICAPHRINACGADGNCSVTNPQFSCNVTRNSTGCVEYARKPKTTEACGEGNYEHDGHREWQKYDVYGTIQSYTGTYHSWSGQDHYIESSDGKHGDTHFLTADSQGAKARYDAAVAARDNLLKQLKACNNYQRTYSEFDPAITFVYNDDYYKNDYLLAATKTTESYSIYNNGVRKDWTSAGYSNSNSTYTFDYSSVYGSSASIFSWNCSVEGRPCYGSSVAYPNNTNVSQTTIKSINYTLPDNVYRYIGKNGVSYNTIEEIIEKNVIPGETDVSLISSKKVKKIDSSIPVSYSKGNCNDEYYLEYYYKNGQANLFGINQKFIEYNKVTTNSTSTVNGVTVSNDYNYKCKYNIIQNFYENQTTTQNTNTTNNSNEFVEGSTRYIFTDKGVSQELGNPYSVSNNNPMCNECVNCSKNGDIRIIYRPISLEDPFPGESGNTRVPGSNWQGIVNSTNKSFVESYITNNRNVKTDDVYKLRPIYEFVLTPTNMRRIREYNNSQKDDYNDDYTLNCYENGDYCLSTFLEKGKGAGYFEFTKENPNGGTCYGADLTNWDTCRYTKVGGS